MPIPGNLLTTAMAVMPHRDVDRAIETALFMDVPSGPNFHSTATMKTCMSRRQNIS